MLNSVSCGGVARIFIFQYVIDLSCSGFSLQLVVLILILCEKSKLVETSIKFGVPRAQQYQTQSQTHIIPLKGYLKYTLETQVRSLFKYKSTECVKVLIQEDRNTVEKDER